MSHPNHHPLKHQIQGKKTFEEQRRQKEKTKKTKRRQRQDDRTRRQDRRQKTRQKTRQNTEEKIPRYYPTESYETSIYEPSSWREIRDRNRQVQSAKERHTMQIETNKQTQTKKPIQIQSPIQTKINTSTITIPIPYGQYLYQSPTDQDRATKSEPGPRRFGAHTSPCFHPLSSP